MAQSNGQLGKSALHVAYYLIHNSNVRLTPLHIGKLVFFSHGWNLGIFGRPLISDIVEAWRYGPVIPSVYHAFQKYGNDRISPDILYGKDDVENLFTDDEKTIMDRVIEVYNKKRGDELIAITHVEGSPWEEYYVKDQHYTEIPNDVIEAYYNKKAKSDDPQN
ncbi:MAG: hypothetical protein K8823_77 [Cenarchaeum symbiont of Oopsacas minuta]|nr:hypothetical protein [Cenarchaeum symbiont of Oopsacas minuta]